MTGPAYWLLLLAAACANEDVMRAAGRWRRHDSSADIARSALNFLRLMATAGHPVRDEDFALLRAAEGVS